MLPQAILFDLDGTLLDSERAICFAVSQALSLQGVTASISAIADHFGAPLEELFVSFTQWDPKKFAQFFEDFRRFHDEHPDKNPPPLPHVVTALTTLQSKGVRLAVATNKPKDRAEQQLAAAGILPFFEVVVGADPPILPKPAPDVPLAACVRLQLAPATTWMVGDTLRDVLSGHRAGCARSILIAYDDERAAAFAEYPDKPEYMIRSLVEISDIFRVES